MQLNSNQIELLHKSIEATFNNDSLRMFTGFKKDELTQGFGDIIGNNFSIKVFDYVTALNRIGKAKRLYELCWEGKEGFQQNVDAIKLHESLNQKPTEKPPFFNAVELDKEALSAIKRLIGKAHTKAAFQQMHALPVYDTNWKNTLTQLEFDFNNTEREKRLGIIDSKEHGLEISKVIHGLLELINELNEQIGTN